VFAIWADTLVPYQAPVLALLRRYSRSGWRRFQNRAGTCTAYRPSTPIQWSRFPC